MNLPALTERLTSVRRRAGAVAAVRAARRRVLTVSKAAPHGEPNTYGLPDGDDLTAEMRVWLDRQLAVLLGNTPSLGAPLPAGALDVTDWTDPMARAFTPLLSAYWEKSYDGTAGKLGARTGLDLDDFAVVSGELDPQIHQQAFDFCASTNATTTQTLEEAHAALRQALHDGLVTKGEAAVGLVARIKAIYQGMSEAKARQIGVTESSRALHAAQEAAAVNSGVVAGKEWLASADCCSLCLKVSYECKRVPLGGTFAVVGDHPTYSHISHPPLHPGCRCSMVDVLIPEYGGPVDPGWGDTLVQPQEDIPDTGYVPPPQALPKPSVLPYEGPRQREPGVGPAPTPRGGEYAPPATLPPDLDVAHLRTLDLHKAEPTWANPQGKLSYGGVVFDDQGRVLLREPANHFDGYHWTFPKGRHDAGEHPVDTALREVTEETGVKGQVLGLVPGGHKGGTGATYFFVMRAQATDPALMDKETQAVRWVTVDEARKLIDQTTNAAGKARDHAVLNAAADRFRLLQTDSRVNDRFKPKPAPVPAPTATPAVAARPAKPPKTAKAPAATFPADPHALNVVHTLGGSTGAVLVEDPATGTRYVRKTGKNPDHIREEAAADAAYQSLGARVPEFRLYETPTGPVKLAEFVEGEALGDLKAAHPALYKKAVADLRKHFVADALLGNWDVLGADADNVRVTPDGKAYRIDNGGALRYRAQGAPKSGTGWNDYPTELWTMRDPKGGPTALPVDGARRHAIEVFGPLKLKDVTKQIDAVAKKEAAVLKTLPPDVAATVRARIAQLKDTARTANTFLGDRFADPYADGIARHQMGIREEGIAGRMPAKLERVPGGVEVKDETGKSWDHLRGSGSLVEDLEKYIASRGGDYRIAAQWMSDQAGSSTSSGSQALAYHLAQQRAAPLDAHYWAEGPDKAKKHYLKAVRTYGKDAYESTVQALHSFTREYLEKADFPNKDAASGTIQLKRSEDKGVIRNTYGLKPGDSGVAMKRKVIESTSIYEWYYLGTTEQTVQNVPVHRVLGTYWQHREPGGYGGAFAGDHENEFVCILEGIPLDYVGGK